MVIKFKSIFLALAIFMAVGVVFNVSAFADLRLDFSPEAVASARLLVEREMRDCAQPLRDEVDAMNAAELRRALSEPNDLIKILALQKIDTWTVDQREAIFADLFVLLHHPNDTVAAAAKYVTALLMDLLSRRITTTGSVFTRDRSHRELGEAWRDPDGLIWGDIVKHEDGSVRRMVQSSEYMKEIGRPLPNGTLGAKEYCESIGARLPSKEEFTRLREYMGARSGTYEGYSGQVLPNLFGHWFWLSSVNPGNAYLAYNFDGGSGKVDNYHRRNSNAVLCVVSR